MNLINVLSLFLFLIFFCSYMLKLFFLNRRNGIQAYVLARGVKSRDVGKVELFLKVTTFFWGVLWLTLSISDIKLKYFISPDIEPDFFRYIGLAVMSAGVSIFIIAMITMKTSWRVGIDKKTKSSLITAGIYKYSRNPAFVGFDIMFIGFILTFPGLLTLTVSTSNIFAVHRLILQEEKHLKSAFGDTYIEYKDKTPRYILLK